LFANFAASSVSFARAAQADVERRGPSAALLGLSSPVLLSAVSIMIFLRGPEGIVKVGGVGGVDIVELS
jgi:hypothetical protein